MKKQFRFTGMAAVVLIGLVLVSCYTNPQTRRKEFVLFTPQEEANLGLTSFNDIKSKTPVSADAIQNEQVQRVGQRIAAVVDLPYAQWEFVVFNEPATVNAFCLPGGKVGVYSGILPLTQDDNGLAVVLGHEISHAVARHGGERMSQALLLQLGGIGLQAALQNKPAQTQQLAMAAYGIGSTVGVELPFSRKEEYEADEMGLMSMAKAGYDPRHAVEFWRRFKALNDQQGGAPPEFLSTHPVDANRIAALEKKLPDAIKVFERR
jgi:predicted Zn-dependent protease